MGRHFLLPHVGDLISIIALSIASSTQAATVTCAANWVVDGKVSSLQNGLTVRQCQDQCQNPSNSCEYFTFYEDPNNTRKTICKLLKGPVTSSARRDDSALVTCAPASVWPKLNVPDKHVGSTGTFVSSVNTGLYTTAAYSTGVIAIHATMLPNSNKVLFFGRPQDFANYPPQPGMGIPGTNPYVSYAAAIVDTISGQVTPVKSDAGAPFCANQIQLSNGQILVCGGDDQYIGKPGNGNWGGYKACRIFRNDNGVWRWDQFKQMEGGHWYPSILELPPGVGGTQGTCGLVMGGVISTDTGESATHASLVCPEAGFLFSNPVEDIGSDRVRESLRTSFPGAILLPIGKPWDRPRFFLLNQRSGDVVKLKADIGSKKIQLEILNSLPNIPFDDFGMAINILPLAFDLTPGGGAVRADDVTLVAFGADAFDWGRPALNKAYRIKPLSSNPQWEVEDMPSRSSYRMVVMLPNGKMVLIGGSRFGQAQGGPECCSSGASAPILQAWIYDPNAPAGSRFTVDPMMSPHVRFYHASAWLGVDGRVYIGGTDQTIEPNYRPGFTMEAYTPLSLRRAQAGGARPLISALSNSSSSLLYNAPLTIEIRQKYVSSCSLVKASSSTHDGTPNQRVLIMKTYRNRVDQSSGEGNIYVKTPKSMFAAPPGWYILYCWDGDLYSVGKWVKLKPLSITPLSVLTVARNSVAGDSLASDIPEPDTPPAVFPETFV